MHVGKQETGLYGNNLKVKTVVFFCHVKVTQLLELHNDKQKSSQISEEMPGAKLQKCTNMMYKYLFLLP